jgi:hypothetical protein
MPVIPWQKRRLPVVSQQVECQDFQAWVYQGGMKKKTEILMAMLSVEVEMVSSMMKTTQAMQLLR